LEQQLDEVGIAPVEFLAIPWQTSTQEVIEATSDHVSRAMPPKSIRANEFIDRLAHKTWVEIRSAPDLSSTREGIGYERVDNPSAYSTERHYRVVVTPRALGRCIEPVVSIVRAQGWLKQDEIMPNARIGHDAYHIGHSTLLVLGLSFAAFDDYIKGLEQEGNNRVQQTIAKFKHHGHELENTRRFTYCIAGAIATKYCCETLTRQFVNDEDGAQLPLRPREIELMYRAMAISRQTTGEKHIRQASFALERAFDDRRLYYVMQKLFS
jgi:hypothetical protein